MNNPLWQNIKSSTGFDSNHIFGSVFLCFNDLGSGGIAWIRHSPVVSGKHTKRTSSNLLSKMGLINGQNFLRTIT